MSSLKARAFAARALDIDKRLFDAPGGSGGGVSARAVDPEIDAIEKRHPRAG